MNGEKAIAHSTSQLTSFAGWRSGRTKSTNSTTRVPAVWFQASWS
jgi:hypothetical protein